MPYKMKNNSCFQDNPEKLGNFVKQEMGLHNKEKCA